MKLRQRLLPIWWFTRCLFGSSKLRPFDIDKWWEGHKKRYQPDWDEFSKRGPEEQLKTLKDIATRLDDLKSELNNLSSRAPLLGAVAPIVVAAATYAVTNANQLLLGVAFILLGLNVALLLLIGSPSLGSLYKRYPSASDWQKLIGNDQDRYTRSMMRIDRLSNRADLVKRNHVRSAVLQLAALALVGAAVFFGS